MHRPNDIRRRRGGSIDTAYYARIGRALHAHAMRGAASSLARLIGAGLKRIGRRWTNGR